jgi:hypothetical protein
VIQADAGSTGGLSLSGSAIAYFGYLENSASKLALVHLTGSWGSSDGQRNYEINAMLPAVEYDDPGAPTFPVHILARGELVTILVTPTRTYGLYANIEVDRHFNFLDEFTWQLGDPTANPQPLSSREWNKASCAPF